MILIFLNRLNALVGHFLHRTDYCLSKIRCCSAGILVKASCSVFHNSEKNGCKFQCLILLFVFVPLDWAYILEFSRFPCPSPLFESCPVSGYGFFRSIDASSLVNGLFEYKLHIDSVDFVHFIA